MLKNALHKTICYKLLFWIKNKQPIAKYIFEVFHNNKQVFFFVVLPL